MYGFHKIPHIEDNSTTKTESQVWEFSNPNFLREQPDMLCLVTRKKSGEASDKDSLDYQAIMGEIQAIKRHQMTISQDLKRIQADNQALWQEQVDTRARHSKHEETIEKILTFLGSVYGNSYNDDKSIRPKKRKLLLQHDSSDPTEAAGNVFDDDRTKETFENMFKSASSSPKLRPLRQPATETASSKIHETSQSAENRFTLPNLESRSQAAASSQQQPMRGVQKVKSSPGPVYSPLASTAVVPSPNEDKAAVNQMRTPQRPRPEPMANFSQALTSLDNSDPMHPMNMQLTPSIQTRISSNNSRANEIEQDLALQDQNIEALASLLGLNPSDLDSSTLDPNLLADINYNNFDDYLNQSASLAASPQSSTNLDSSFEAFTNGAAKHDMNPPTSVPTAADTPLTNGSTNGSVSGSKPRIVSAATTPSPINSNAGSTTGSVVDEEIEEIDMDKARGKKRKSTG